MREIIKHKPGKAYLLVLLLGILCMLYMVHYFDRKILVFGILPLPFFVGICFLAILAIAQLIYSFKYWPYR